MWIKAPAKQLAQSSALASLTGLSEYPFSVMGEGKKYFSSIGDNNGTVRMALNAKKKKKKTELAFYWLILGLFFAIFSSMRSYKMHPC